MADPTFPAYVIDSERNRDSLVDPAAGEAYLAAIAARTDLRSRGERVSLLRLLGRLDEAEREAREAYVHACAEGTARQRIAALIRLAHVVQWKREWPEANRLFDEAIGLADDLGEPLTSAFAYQHAGRNHVDQGRFDDAIESFRTALSLREANDAPPDQLESTRATLRVATRLSRSGRQT